MTSVAHCLGSRRGVTLVELVIAMVVGLIVVGAAAPLLTLSSRGLEQQRNAQQVQSGAHVVAEMLIRDIRNTDGVRDGATQTRLLLDGGPLAVPCGGNEYWIEFEDEELRCGPDSEAAEHSIARTVTEVLFEYGIDSNEDGIVDSFQSTVTSSNEDDVLAVRFVVTLASEEGRGGFESTTEFLAVIRAAVLNRLELES